MAIAYPDLLPCPLFDGFDLNTVSPLIRSELASGRARQRRRYTSTPTMVNVAWLLTTGQAQVFETWFRWEVIDGVEWIDMPLKTPMGVKTYESRFVDIYSGPKIAAPRLWRFEATMELRDRPTFSDAWKIAYPYMAFSDLFDLAVNEEYPPA